MKKFIFLATVIASMFPYTQIFPLDSYTQPYALIFSIAASIYAFPAILKNAPVLDNVAIIGLFFVGIVSFLISCLPHPGEQDIKSLIMYVSPLFFYSVAFGFARLDISLFRKVVSYCAIVWLIVGIVQAFIHPSFASQFVGEWSDASEVVVESGRGVISLAPEPTHYAFHMILLASIIYLLCGQSWLIFSCLLSTILLARSSSAILVLGVSVGLLFSLNPLRLLFYWLSCVLIFVLILIINLGQFDQSDIRVFQLMSVFLSDPMFIIQADHSVNARVGGLVAGMGVVFDNFFIPVGLSNEDWLLHVPYILRQHPWLFDISSAGIPSGFVIILYQIGFLGVFFVYLFISRTVSVARSLVGMYLMFAALIVFMGQFLISNPLFGLMLGCAAASRVSPSCFTNTYIRNAV